MAAAPYILARNLKEAHGFAREELGLAHGRYRVVNTPSTLKSLRNVDLHLVPGWQNRFDRFAMKGALRWTRMNVIDHADDAPVDAVKDDLEPAGEQMTLSPITPDEAHTLVTAPEPEQTEESVKRRRSRCKECGTLHFKEEACAQTETLEGM